MTRSTIRVIVHSIALVLLMVAATVNAFRGDYNVASYCLLWAILLTLNEVQS